MKYSTPSSGTCSTNGPRQPPRNSTAVSAPTVKACKNSATKNMPNFMPEYSMWKPATISDSASSRSNGVRPTSATEVTKKIKAAIGAATMNHTDCAWTMPFRSMLRARITGTSRLKIIGASYDTNCATVRNAPNRAYLLLDAQPPIIMARVPSEPTLTMYSAPTLSEVPRMLEANGTTAHMLMIATTDRIGAML